MDYMKFIEHHRATEADITIGVLPVDRSKASEFGVMKIDDQGRIKVPTHFCSCTSSVPVSIAAECCWAAAIRLKLQISVVVCL